MGYHLTAKAVSFGCGQSAVHTSAYNARTQLKHEREDRVTKDYGKLEAPLFVGIFAPKNAPAWVQDREQLWNKAEAAERQANGQPARNMIVAFPHELNQRQREFLIKDFAREEFARRGMIADVAMHAPDKEGDQRNYHAHILLTMRKLDGPEFAKTKCREWNSKEQLGQWREGWAERGAKALERAGYAVEAERWRHGHRTLGEQRAAALERGDRQFAASLEREPTPHRGPRATAMDRRGMPSERMERVREIIARNEIRLEQKAIGRELAALEREDKEARSRSGAGPGADHALGWTDRAGMVAQERSAMAWVRAADRDQHQPAGPAPKDRLLSFEDRDRNGDRQSAPIAALKASNKWLGFFEERNPERAPMTGPRPGAELQVVDSSTGRVSSLAAFLREEQERRSAPGQQADGSVRPGSRWAVSDPAMRKNERQGRLASIRQAARADKALERIGQDMAAGRPLKAEDIASLHRRDREQIRDKGADGLWQLVEGFHKRKGHDDRER